MRFGTHLYGILCGFILISLLGGCGSAVPEKVSDETLKIRLAETILPVVASDGLTSVEYFRMIEKQAIQIDPWFKRIAFVDSSDIGKPKLPDMPTISVRFKKIPIDEALRFMASKQDLQIEIFDGRILLLRKTETTQSLQELMAKNIPPNFFDMTGKSEEDRWMDVKEEMLLKGMIFPEGGSAFYSSKSHVLKLINTRSQIDYFDMLIVN